MTHNQAKDSLPIHDLLARRFSPYGFAPREVEDGKLICCLEAARWAASSYNEQPWTFIVARKSEPKQFSQMLDCLVEGNQSWAGTAGVLIITVAKKKLQRNQHPNTMVEHDIGLAVGNFTFQANSLNLFVHEMAGIKRTAIRLTYSIPTDHEPLTALAIGYLPDAATRNAHDKQRTRRQLNEFVFESTWNNAATFI